MKVVMVGHTIPQSGIAGISRAISRYVYYIASGLIEKGNEVKLFIRNDIPKQEQWIEPVFSPKFSWVPYPRFVYEKIKKETADVYHSDYVTTGAPLVWAKKKPSVVSIHDVIPFTYDKSKLSFADKLRVRWYMKCFRDIEQADAIVVASQYAKSETLKYTKIPEEKIHVVHFGVDQKMLYPIQKPISDTVKVGYLGGLDGRKNVELLLQSFYSVSGLRRKVELHIGGTGNNLERFKRMNIPNTYFHGLIGFEKVNEFLNSLDIFVFPTLSEGFGLPVMEAMAAGIPIIATNASTMPEIVGDAGILVEPNVESMSEAIINLIENDFERKRLSVKSLSRSKMFIWDKIVDSVLEVYKSVM